VEKIEQIKMISAAMTSETCDPLSKVCEFLLRIVYIFQIVLFYVMTLVIYQ